MKKLILISALLFSFNGWAEEEYPIELTCYVADAIMYFHFEESIKGSWYLFDKEIMPFGEVAIGIFGGQGNRATKRRYNEYAGKRMNDFLEIEISNTYIKVKSGALLFAKPTFFINRVTGSFNHRGTLFSLGSGVCLSGLEIAERKF